MNVFESLSDRILASINEGERMKARIGLWTSLSMALILAFYGFLLWKHSQVTLAVLWLTWAGLFILGVITCVRSKRIVPIIVTINLILLIIVPFAASLKMGSFSSLAYSGFLMLVPLIAIIFIPQQFLFWTGASAIMLLAGILLDSFLVLDPNLPAWFVRSWYTGPTLVSLIISAAIVYYYVRQNEAALELLGQEREKLRQMANSDPLTGIYNRRYFFERARHIHKQYRRYKRPYSILMFDMDDFKSVNDHFGHAAGDAVLCEVVQRLGDNIRDVDILARYGGEEFILLMPETKQEHAHQTAERLLTLINEQPMLFGEEAIHVTTSIGVAGILDEREKLEDVIERSDQALYQAKGQGKNRVMLSRISLIEQIPLPLPGNGA